MLLDFITNAITSLATTITGCINQSSLAKEEKDKLQAEIQTKLIEAQNTMLNQAAQSITTEETGNWLQRSWRPILMLLFGFVLLYEYFIQPVFRFDPITLPTQFWTLLEIGIGGYITGRTIEKVTGTS